ncbi:hypothetical protein NDU88_000287 [Pleurodeles waltl]|uniref:Uncharacterized protein n=1 Tax=Pleurodeles waltl TaxID=8319 RepID=A0AAV7MGE3_PLEWA|nr:hypothetical protein NDU88_000287 [Pleurodeles waltl]
MRAPAGDTYCPKNVPRQNIQEYVPLDMDSQQMLLRTSAHRCMGSNQGRRMRARLRLGAHQTRSLGRCKDVQHCGQGASCPRLLVVPLKMLPGNPPSLMACAIRSRESGVAPGAVRLQEGASAADL